MSDSRKACYENDQQLAAKLDPISLLATLIDVRQRIRVLRSEDLRLTRMEHRQLEIIWDKLDNLINNINSREKNMYESK